MIAAGNTAIQLPVIKFVSRPSVPVPGPGHQLVTAQTTGGQLLANESLPPALRG
jgi:hypothetical protein